MIKVGLIGLGKTGSEVARQLVMDQSVQLVCVFKYHDCSIVDRDIGDVLGLGPAGTQISLCENYRAVLEETKPDVMIDFAAGRNVLHYLEDTASLGINMVICSTGYNEAQINVIQSFTDRMGLVWAQNITDGINILAKLGEFVKDAWPDSDISIIETHFSEKKGVSATAMKLAEKIRDTEDIKIGPQTEYTRENDIIIHKVRSGGVVGQHQVIFGNPFQTITLTHNTISRRAFGAGAIRAAHWIHEKKGFFQMNDVIES